MKRVAIVGYAQHPILKNAGALNEVELIMPVVHQLFNDLGISQRILILPVLAVVIIYKERLCFFEVCLPFKPIHQLKNLT